MDILSWILTFALSSGQLIRVPFFSGGITVLDLAVVSLSLYGLLMLKFKLKKTPFLIPGLIFIFIAILSLIFTPLHLNTGELFNAFSYTGRFLLYLFFAWVFFSMKKNFSKGFIFSGFAVAVLGLLQIFFLPDLRFLTNQGWDPHYFRLVSTFLDPNFTGAFLVLTLILIMQLKKTRVSCLFFIMVFLALLLTFSRSSYGMLLVSGLTFSFLKRSIKYFFATLMLFAILLLGFETYSRMVATPRNISRDKSASFRLNTWQQGFTIFKNHPVLGIGFNAYRYGIKEYNLGDKQFLESHGSAANDSSLLFVLSTTGILGFGAYLYFLFTLLKSNKILAVGLIGLLFHSFFANSLFYPPILALILVTGATSKK